MIQSSDYSVQPVIIKQDENGQVQDPRTSSAPGYISTTKSILGDNGQEYNYNGGLPDGTDVTFDSFGYDALNVRPS